MANDFDFQKKPVTEACRAITELISLVHELKHSTNPNAQGEALVFLAACLNHYAEHSTAAARVIGPSVASTLEFLKQESDG